MQRLGMLAPVAVERLAEDLEQVVERDLLEIELDLVAGEQIAGAGVARPHRPAHAVGLGQRVRDLLHPLVLEQAAHQVLARVVRRSPELLGGPRQQHARLELDQQRRLVDVLAGDVEVELLHQRQVLVELVADQRPPGCR